MDTEKIASLCLKILNATDYAEAHGVLEPIDDIGYTEKQVFVQCSQIFYHPYFWLPL
jgi:hypothetical protein